MGLWVWGLGFGVWGVGCGFWVLGCGVWGLGFGGWVLGFGVWGFLGVHLDPRLVEVNERPLELRFELLVRHSN